MNIFQLLLSLRRRPAASSAAATMATRSSLQCADSLGSPAWLPTPLTQARRGETRSPLCPSSQPGAQRWLSANTYRTLTNSSVCSRCQQRGLALTWRLAAHQRCSLPPQSSAWVKTQHTKEEVGGRRGKCVTKKSQGVSPSLLRSLGDATGWELKPKWETRQWGWNKE